MVVLMVRSGEPGLGVVNVDAVTTAGSRPYG